MIWRSWFATVPLLIQITCPGETLAPSPACNLNKGGVVPARLADPLCAVRTVASVVTEPVGNTQLCAASATSPTAGVPPGLAAGPVSVAPGQAAYSSRSSS